MFLGGHVFEQINMKKKTFLEHMCNKKLTQMCVDIHKHLIESWLFYKILCYDGTSQFNIIISDANQVAPQ
jgi:hypothetical protein